MLCVHKTGLSAAHHSGFGHEDVLLFFSITNVFFPLCIFSTQGHGLYSPGEADFGNTWTVATKSGDPRHPGCALSEESSEDDRSLTKVRMFGHHYSTVILSLWFILPFVFFLCLMLWFQIFLISTQIYLLNGHPGKKWEAFLQTFNGRHRGTHANRLHSHCRPGLHSLWTHF